MLYVVFNIIFLFFRFLIFLFKWGRLIFILISLEYFILSLFFFISVDSGRMYFFYFICFSVISRVAGMVVIINGVKNYGRDVCLFCRFRLNFKLLIFKIRDFFCIFRGLSIIILYFFFEKKIYGLT